MLFQEVIHSAHLFDKLELEQPLNVGVLRVHQHVDQLPIICSHALGIQNFVSPSNLKDGGEIVRVLFKASVFDHLLANFIIRSHCQAGQNGADVSDLFVDSAGLRLPRQDINLVSVLADLMFE